MAIIQQFDSEEDYWNYEFEVYKKDLPIQKYMAAKEKEFKEVAPQAKSINEIEEEWQEYFVLIKAQAVENEEFKVVDYIVINLYFYNIVSGYGGYIWGKREYMWHYVSSHWRCLLYVSFI